MGNRRKNLGCGRLRGAAPCAAALIFLALIIRSPALAAGGLRQPEIPEEWSEPLAQEIVGNAKDQIGTPYRLGKNVPGKGFDCSGLVWWTFKQSGLDVPRVTSELAKAGTEVDLEDAQPGDVIIFKTGRSPNGLHTGIISDEGKFIHAPRKGKKVNESDIDDYWRKRIVSVRRIGNGLVVPALPTNDEILLALTSGDPEEYEAALRREAERKAASDWRLNAMPQKNPASKKPKGKTAKKAKPSASQAAKSAKTAKTAGAAKAKAKAPAKKTVVKKSSAAVKKTSSAQTAKKKAG